MLPRLLHAFRAPYRLHSLSRSRPPQVRKTFTLPPAVAVALVGGDPRITGETVRVIADGLMIMRERRPGGLGEGSHAQAVEPDAEGVWRDVGAAGGWKDTQTLVKCYQEAGPDTIEEGILGGRELRLGSEGGDNPDQNSDPRSDETSEKAGGTAP